MVERLLAKEKAAGSSPVSRSESRDRENIVARELANIFGTKVGAPVRSWYPAQIWPRACPAAKSALDLYVDFIVDAIPVSGSSKTISINIKQRQLPGAALY